MTILTITDVNDIRDIVSNYIHEGGGIYRSRLSHGVRFQIPLEYVKVEPVLIELSDASSINRPIATHKIIEIDDEMYVELPGGTIPYDEWMAMTHTKKDRQQHPRQHHAPAKADVATKYSAGESNSGRPVIKMGRRTIEWGFKSSSERDNRLSILIDVERS